MAAKTKPKRSVRKKGASKNTGLFKGGGQPYDPLAPSFQNQGQYNAAVRSRAQSQYRPDLLNLRSEQNAEERAHTGRVSDIQGLYNSYGSELSKAYDDANQALNKIIGSENASTQSAQGALQGALRSSQEQQGALTQQLGGAPTSPAPSQASLGAAYGIGEAAKTNTNTSVAQALAAAASRQALPALGKLQAVDTENRRNRGVLADIRGKRRDVTSRIGEFREKARSDISSEEQNRENLRFQQRIAQKKLGLDKRTAGLEEAKFTHQQKIDWAQIFQHQQELDDAAANAQDQGSADAADQRSKAYASGSSFIASYLAPQAGETFNKTGGGHSKGQTNAKRYNARLNPANVFNHLTKNIGMPAHDAVVLMGTIDNPKFVAWVRRHRAGKPPSTKTVGEGILGGVVNFLNAGQ